MSWQNPFLPHPTNPKKKKIKQKKKTQRSLKKKKNKFKSRAFEAIHSAADRPSRLFPLQPDAMRTKPTARRASHTNYLEKKNTGKNKKGGPPVFAHYLNNSVSKIKKGGRGAKPPNGFLKKTHNIVKKHGLGVLL
ncbi:transcriptional regulator [Escherichia coli]|nr:transcriptional regulator [Escherichia coli]WCQ53727.1 transcriptional regulator [Escherichia coli]